MKSQQCPSRQKLIDFHGGRISTERREEIAHHLEHCDKCSTLLDSLKGSLDNATGRLREKLPEETIGEKSETHLLDALPDHLNRLSVAGSAEKSAGGSTIKETVKESIERTLDLSGTDEGVVNQDIPLNNTMEATSNIPGTRDELADKETQSTSQFVEATGDQIGPYKILEKLGEGGMGTVYLAEQRKPVIRRVALKIIKVGMDTGQVIARFEAERQALAMMEHASIAKVFDAGTTATGRPYFVMELVQGTPITKFCDDRKLGIRERLELFNQVCGAVQHAHQKGIVHRDLKPTNILVALQDDKPIPKVIDFGLAKATNQRLTEKTMFTAHGQVLGTLEYMSPEQAHLNDMDVDTRSDIYSLGVILYELLTGSTPLKRESLQNAGFMEILSRIKDEEPDRPSSRITESIEALDLISSVRQVEPRKFSVLMKGDLDWIVVKAIEKDRARRYETANSLAADIRRYLKDEPIEARPPSAGYRMQKMIRKNRLAVGFASTVVLLLLVGIGVSSYLAMWGANEATTARTASRRADAERDKALEAQAATEEQRTIAQASAEEAGRQRAEALRRVYTADIQRASFELEHGNLYDAQLALERHHVEPNGEDIRGWEWYYLRARCGRESMTLREHSSIVDAIAWHPYKDVLASLSLVGGRLLIYDVDRAITHQDLKIEDLTAARNLQIPLLQWSVDGNFLMALFTSKSGALRCVVWDVETGKALFDKAETIFYAAWSPLESELALLFSDGTLKTWSADDTEPIVLTQLDKEMPEKDANARICWAPDGKHIAVEHTKQTEIISVSLAKSILQVSRNSMPSIIANSQGGGGGGGFSSSATSSNKTDVNLSSLGVAWSPDSSHLVTVRTPVYLSVIDLANPDKPKPIYLMLGNHRIGNNAWLSWSPDRDCLALCTSDSLVVVNNIVKLSRPYAYVYSTEGILSGVAWHNDGTHLYTFDDTGCMEVWNSVSGEKVDRFGAHTSRIFASAWNCNRTRFATCGGDAAIRIWRPHGLVPPEFITASTLGKLEWHPTQKHLYHSSFRLIDLEATEVTRWSLDKPQPLGPQPFVKAWVGWHNAGGSGSAIIKDLKWDRAAGEVTIAGMLSGRSKRIDGKYTKTAPSLWFILRWDPETDVRRLVRVIPTERNSFLALGANGSFFAVERGKLVRFNADGEEEGQCAIDRTGFSQVQATHDCSSLIALRRSISEEDERWSLVRASIEEGELWTKKLPHSSNIFAISPDSKLIAYDQIDEASGVARLVLCALADGRIIQETPAHALPPTDVKGAPEGCGLLTFSRNRLVSGLQQELKVWDATNLQEMLRIGLRTSGAARYGVFSPDQKTLAVCMDAKVIFLNAEPGYRMSEPLDEAYFIRKVRSAFGGGGMF